MVPHIMRYAHATQFAWGKQVVDLGCGSGYGSYILSMVAEKVTGLDMSIDTIFYAGDTFEAHNLFFGAANLDNGYIPPADLYVAFEVLEHLDNPDWLVQTAKPMLWSIPISNANQWHKHVYSFQDIEALMGSISWVQDGVGNIKPITNVNRGAAVYALGITE